MTFYEKQAYRKGYAKGMKHGKKQAKYHGKQKDCKQTQAIEQNDSKKNLYIELLKNQNQRNKRKVI